MLDRYRESQIEPKDHVLLFRTFVAMNDVDSAEATFRSLGESMSSLMLNLLLLTCVNTKQPERALTLLHEARAFEARRNGKAGVEGGGGGSSGGGELERIVDVVS